MSLQAKCYVLITLWVIIVICEGTTGYLSSCLLDGGMKWTMAKADTADSTKILPGGFNFICPDKDSFVFFNTPFVLSNTKGLQGRFNTARIITVTSSSKTLPVGEGKTGVYKDQTTHSILQSTVSDAINMLCPINMIYGNCSCQATCADPRNGNGCNKVCSEEETCVCPDGFLMNGDDCVPEQECGCFLEGEGVIKGGGFFIDSSCSTRCACQDNQLKCENLGCSASETCREIDGAHQCDCKCGFVLEGQMCVVAPTDCLDLYNAGVTTDGVYTIYPTGWEESGFEVYCEMESNGGGWTVFQRRVNGTVDFYRNWVSYKQGFGKVKHEFWLGNDKVHTLTHLGNQQLRIDVGTPDGTYYSIFSSFYINNETDKYRLSVGTQSGNTVGNPLKWNNGQPFSTYDQDNDDTSTYNCAEKHRGAWWYNYHTDNYNICWKWRSGAVYEFCSDSNPNGVYNEDKVESMYFWYNFDHQSGCGIRQTEMKLRRVQLTVNA